MADASKHTGHVIWRELMTSHLEKAKGFYGELFGWSFDAMPMPGGEYTIVKSAGKGIAGVIEANKETQVPPMWLSYVSVPDTDEACAAAQEAGGTIVFGPVTMEGVGRMATVVDFAGASFCVMTPTGPNEAPGQPALHTFCWETLSTSDPERARKFYAAVCGWKDASRSPELPVLGAPDGTQVADLQVARNMPPAVFTYVVVESIEASCERTQKLGGKVVVPRMDIPKVGAIGMIADPLGAVLGLFVPQMA